MSETFASLYKDFQEKKEVNPKELAVFLDRLEQCSTEDDNLEEWVMLNIFLRKEIAFNTIFTDFFIGFPVEGPKSPLCQKTYIMYDENTGLYKIGKSKNPRIRERTLQSEKPTISLFLVCEKDIEKELHKRYAEKRVRGEWFELNNEDIIQLKKILLANDKL